MSWLETFKKKEGVFLLHFTMIIKMIFYLKWEIHSPLDAYIFPDICSLES